MSRFSTRFLAVVMAGALTLQPGFVTGTPQVALAVEPDEEALSRIYDRFATIERGLANLDELEARLERRHTDPLARARALDNDATAIVEDVTDNIRYLPYAGSLRAADGTLASRSGNAIDQAVLLATMLNRTGLEARVVRGKIDQADATTLLESVSQPPAGRPAFSEEDMETLRQKVGTDLPDLAATFSPASPEDMKATWLQGIEVQQEMLVSALGQAAPPEKAELPGWMTEAAKDYWWVQYRDEPAGAWTDAHPAWPGDEAPASLEGVGDAYYSALPRRAVQRITLRLEMDIQEGDGDTKTLKLAEIENVPGSELARKPVTLSITPDTLAANPQADLQTAMQEAHFMLAGLNGNRTHDPFTLSGVVVPPDALGAQSYGMADLFATVSDKGERAISALSGDENTDVLAIRTMRLEIISKAPGMADRRDTRILYDAVEADGTVLRRESGDIAAELTGTYLIGARTGRVSETGLAEAMIGQARNIAHLIEYDVFRDMVQPDRLPPVSDVVSDIDPSIPLMQLAFAETQMPQANALAELSGPLARLGLTSSTIGLEAPPILMPERPLVRMISAEGFVNDEAGADQRYAMRRTVDLVASPVIAISQDMQSIQPRASLRAGIWMSQLEGDATPAEADARSFDTGNILNKAAEQDIPLITLLPAADEEDTDTPALPAAFEELELPRESLAAIRNDLQAGYAVQAPKRLPGGVPYGAWWRVHPETGETLAMLDTGRGAEYQEYLDVLSFGLNVISAVMMAEGTQDCMSDDFNKEGGSLACCLVTSALPMGPAGASMAGSIKAGHPAVMFALAFISVNSAIMGGIVGDSMDLSGKCYE